MIAQTPAEHGPLHRVGVSGPVPVLRTRNLVKRYGRVTGLAGADLDLYPGEVLAVVGSSGAGKSSLARACSGALIPDSGQIWLDGEQVHFGTPADARAAGIQTFGQETGMADSPGRDDRRPVRGRTHPGSLGPLFVRSGPRPVVGRAERLGTELGIVPAGITSSRTVARLFDSHGDEQRRTVMARKPMHGGKVVILDEPTAMLGPRESDQVLQLIGDLRDRGLPVLLISHNLPHVFDVADRIHVQRLGRRVAVVTPSSHSMSQIVAIMTGAAAPPDHPLSFTNPERR